MIVRGVSRARANTDADHDPEHAAWQLRTTTRYDDRGGFTLTIRGPAHLLPVITAGLDARKTQLRRERDAATNDVPAKDVAANADVPVPVLEPGPATQRPEPVPSTPADLDAQADGWPTGTTRRQVLQAAEHLTAFHRDLGAEQVQDETPGTRPPRRPVPPRGPATDRADESSDDDRAPTDADALLALAKTRSRPSTAPVPT